MRQIGHGALAVDLGAQAVGIGSGEKLPHRHRDVVLVGEQVVAVAVSQPASFDLQMQALGAVRVDRAKVEAREHVQHQERGQALVVGGHLVDIVAAIGGADRRLVVALRSGEVVECVQAA